MADDKHHPSIMSKKSMEAVAGTAGSGTTLFSEIFTQVNNAKDKPKKVEILRQYDNQPLRQLLKGAFDPKIEWDLPDGDPPFIANQAPLGTEHALLGYRQSFARL